MAADFTAEEADSTVAVGSTVAGEVVGFTMAVVEDSMVGDGDDQKPFRRLASSRGGRLARVRFSVHR